MNKTAAVKTELEDWREKYPDIAEDQARECIAEIRATLPGVPDDRKVVYLENYCHWESDKHEIAKYLLFYVNEAISFYYERKDPEKPDHPFLKIKPLHIIQSEINQRGPLAVWNEYRGYIPLNIKNTRKSKLFSMWLLLEIFDIYKPLAKQDTVGEPATVNNKRKYVLPFNSKMKSDMMKFKKAGRVKWDGNGKPDFNNRLLIIALVQYWRETYFDIPELQNENIKYQLINDTFLFRGNNPKVKNYTVENQYEKEKEKLKSEIEKILNSPKKY